MFIKIRNQNAILSVFITCVLLISGTVSAQPYTRAFLKELADKYLDAVVTRDPSGLPLSPSIKSVPAGHGSH